jgi:ankyrin repeat protein
MSKELINAILDNNDELIKEIIHTNNKEALNYQDSAGFTALHFAIQDNKYDYALQLIEAGVNFEIPDMYGNTALIRAVSSFRGDGRIIKLLLHFCFRCFIKFLCINSLNIKGLKFIRQYC